MEQKDIKAQIRKMVRDIEMEERFPEEMRIELSLAEHAERLNKSLNDYLLLMIYACNGDVVLKRSALEFLETVEKELQTRIIAAKRSFLDKL